MIFTKPPSDFTSLFEIAVCITEWSGEVVLLQRQRGKKQENEWGVPAGKVAMNETPIAAAIRELFEETGIEINEIQIRYITTLYDRFPDMDFTAHIFHSTLLKKPLVTINYKEHQDYVWVTPQQALTMNHMLDVDYSLRLVFPQV